jgi:hypothetical protein
MSHYQAAKRFLEDRRWGKTGMQAEGCEVCELSEPSPVITPLTNWPLPPWEVLRDFRWGPGVSEPTPGIVIDRPNRDRMRAAVARMNPDPTGDSLEDRP